VARPRASERHTSIAGRSSILKTAAKTVEVATAGWTRLTIHVSPAQIKYFSLSGDTTLGRGPVTLYVDDMTFKH
jgi:hypothetical protein